MTRRKIMLAASAASIVLVSAGLIGLGERYSIFDDDDDDDDDEGDELFKSIDKAKINLQQGLGASEQVGRPISGKFEVEDGKFQLSVYTAKDGQFSEVLVNYGNAELSKVEKITDGDDLTAAQSQSVAMASAKSSLKEAVESAVAQNTDFRAVGVVPTMKDGHATAQVLLLKGTELKTVALPLE